MQTTRGTGLNAGRLESLAHAIGAERALIDLLRLRVELRNVEGTPGNAIAAADADRWQEDISDWHPDPLGLSRHRRGCRADVARLGQSAVADGNRSKRLHAGVQRFSRED